MKKIHTLFFVICMIITCSKNLTNPYTEQGSMEFGPKEIAITIDRMTRSLLYFIEHEWKKEARIQVKDFLNQSSEQIDSRFFTDTVISELRKNKVNFIERKFLTHALVLYQTTGKIYPEHGDIPIGKIKSPNIYLYGSIRDNVRTVNGNKIQYLVINFKLYKLLTSELIWQDNQTFYKVTKIKEKI